MIPQYQNHNSAIVILGGGMIKDKATGRWRTTNFNEGDKFAVDGGRLRVDAVAYLYQANPDCRIICSGGKGQYAHIPDAASLSSVIKRELIVCHVPASKIIQEGKSGNTVQQLYNTSQLARRKKISRLVLISNRYHLPRIKTMLELLPALKESFKSLSVKLLSAEEICLKYDQHKWQPLIDRVYKTQAMKKRILLEQQGVRDLKQGKYKF